MRRDSDLPPLNPFSAAWIEPGALAFIPEPGQDLERLARGPADSGGAAQLIGPHGSGKSALLHALLPRWRTRYGQIRWLTVTGRSEGFGRAPTLKLDCWEKPPGPGAGRTLLIVDGFDGWNGWTRFLVARAARRLGYDLVATTHRDLGWPTLVRMQPDPQRFVALARQRQHASPLQLSDAELLECYRQAAENFREAFFRAYDAIERRRRAA